MKRFIYGWGSVWVQNETLTCCFLSFYRAMCVRYRHAAGKWDFTPTNRIFILNFPPGSDRIHT